MKRFEWELDVPCRVYELGMLEHRFCPNSSSFHHAAFDRVCTQGLSHSSALTKSPVSYHVSELGTLSCGFARDYSFVQGLSIPLTRQCWEELSWDLDLLEDQEVHHFRLYGKVPKIQSQCACLVERGTHLEWSSHWFSNLMRLPSVSLLSSSLCLWMYLGCFLSSNWAHFSCCMYLGNQGSNRFG